MMTNRIRGLQMLSVLVILTLLLPGAMPVQPASASAVEPLTSFDCSTATGIPQSECEALVALYNSTNGDGWTNHSNWLATTCLLYTSDAADDLLCVALGGRRIIKKKTNCTPA